jgi:hypothetical protein
MSEVICNKVAECKHIRRGNECGLRHDIPHECGNRHDIPHECHGIPFECPGSASEGRKCVPLDLRYYAYKAREK